jgi:5-methylcytosine-specific restriction endonuclease McrA
MAETVRRERSDTTFYARKEVKARILAKTAFRCWYCGIELIEWPLAGHNSSVDHKVPKSRGGSDDPDNLLACCRTCNGRKADMLIEEYRERFHIHRFWGETQGRRMKRLLYSPDMRRVKRKSRLRS